MNHPEPAVLAEFADGLLDEVAATSVRAHLSSCSDCRSVLQELAAVPAALADTPAPPMPSDVQDRIERALRGEAIRRSAQESAQESAHGSAQGSAPKAGDPDELAERRRARRGRLGRRLLAAAAVVVVAGVGGVVAVDVLGNGGGAGSGGGVTSAQSGAEQEAQSDVRPDGQSDARSGAEPEAARPNGSAGPSAGTQGDARSDGTAQGPQAVAPRDQEQSGLIEQVYLSRTVVALRERADCVGAALSDPGWQGSSYSVQLPGGGPGAVAFQPAPNAAEPGERVVGMLIRCGDSPQVIDRQPLAQ